MQVKKLAPDMRPAACLLNAATVIQPVEAGVCSRLERAIEILEIPVWMLSSAIRRVSKPDRLSCRVTGRAIITNVRPQAPLFCLPLTWRQDWNRRVIGVQFASTYDVLPQSFMQGLQQSAGWHPPSQRVWNAPVLRPRVRRSRIADTTVSDPSTSKREHVPAALGPPSRVQSDG